MKYILFSFLLMITGCGIYSFSSGRGVGGITTVAVEPFDNLTSEYGIRDVITDAVLDRLLNDRTLTVVPANSADGVLKGSITGVDDQPLTFDENEQVSEYQVLISVELRLVHPEKTEPIWQAKLSGRGSYPADRLEERQKGIDEAIDQLVLDMVNRLTSDW